MIIEHATIWLNAETPMSFKLLPYLFPNDADLQEPDLDIASSASLNLSRRCSVSSGGRQRFPFLKE